MTFTKLKRQHNKCIQTILELSSVIDDAEKDLNRFYSTMRWKDTGLSQEEYESLFDIVYSMEQYDLLEQLSNIAISLKALSSNNKI